MPGIPSRRALNLPVQNHHRDAIVEEKGHDAYRDRGRFEDGTACPECGAVSVRGRWTWSKPDRVGPAVTCPACRRTADNFPAGVLTLEGLFVVQHEAELIEIAKIEEAAEKAEHPLNRIIAVNISNRLIEITTTDTHTPRRIGEAIQHAFHGTCDVAYEADDAAVRVRWTR